MNRREFLRTFWIVGASLLEKSAFSTNLLSALTQEESESREICTEKVAEITAERVFDFCQKEIKEGNKFNEEESAIVKEKMKAFFMDSPLCSVEGGKVHFHLDKNSAERMVEYLLPMFRGKLHWRMMNIITVLTLGRKGGHWQIIFRCLKYGWFKCNPEAIFVQDIGKGIAGINEGIVGYTAVIEGDEELSPITIGEVLGCLDDIFENEKFRAVLEALRKKDPQYLKQSIGTLSYDDFRSRL